MILFPFPGTLVMLSNDVGSDLSRLIVDYRNRMVWFTKMSTVVDEYWQTFERYNYYSHLHGDLHCVVHKETRHLFNASPLNHAKSNNPMWVWSLRKRAYVPVMRDRHYAWSSSCVKLLRNRHFVQNTEML